MKVNRYYHSRIRLWVAHVVDEEGNRLGPSVYALRGEREHLPLDPSLYPTYETYGEGGLDHQPFRKAA